MTRVLVAWASKHRSTAEIAEAVAAELRAQGLDADCVEAASADPTGYDAVVLGSAVYTGRWLKPARRFLKANLGVLGARPFWIFSSGPTGEKVAEELAQSSRWLEPRKVLALAESAGVRGHVVFAGRIPPDPHGMVETAMARGTPPELQDARDWDAVRDWARQVAAELA